MLGKITALNNRSVLALPIVSGMIPLQTLLYLVRHKLKDAQVLADNRRFPAAVYIAGYAVELALKHRICQSLQFEQGFPETREELSSELINVNRYRDNPLRIPLQALKSHNFVGLSELIALDITLRNALPEEWKVVKRWTPALRYQKKRFLEKPAFQFLRAAERIIQFIQ